jgi:protein disulfide-isomerase
MRKLNFNGILVVWLVTAMLSVACGRKKNVAAAEAPSEAKTTWLTNFDAAQARARAEKKWLLIDFTGSDWCPPCIMLERQVFAQPEFKAYAAQHLVLLQVDFPRRKELSDEQKAANEKLAERFEIDGFPTVVVLDSAGKILGQLGYMRGGPEAFIAALEKLPATE